MLLRLLVLRAVAPMPVVLSGANPSWADMPCMLRRASFAPLEMRYSPRSTYPYAKQKWSAVLPYGGVQG